METIPKKHTTIHIACSPDLYARLKQEADKEGMLVTAFVRRLLLLYFKGRLVIVPDEGLPAQAGLPAPRQAGLPVRRRVWHGGG